MTGQTRKILDIGKKRGKYLTWKHTKKTPDMVKYMKKKKKKKTYLTGENTREINDRVKYIDNT